MSDAEDAAKYLRQRNKLASALRLILSASGKEKHDNHDAPIWKNAREALAEIDRDIPGGTK